MLPKEIKISIIIPVYNVEEYLPKCLDSVVNQTLKDIEIICINDGSTDNSLEILQEFAKKDQRIKIIDKENEGVSAARNYGLDIAQGEYIMFVDSDDWIEPETFSILYKDICKNKTDILFFNWFIINGKHKKFLNWTNIFNNNEVFYFNDVPEGFFNLPTSMSCGIFKRVILNERFETDIKKTEDALYLWKILLKNPKISILDKPLYNYLQRDKSTMHNPNIITRYDLFKSINVLMEYEEYNKASDFIKMNILDRFAKSLLYEIYNYTEKEKLKLPKAFYKKSYKFIKLAKTLVDYNKYQCVGIKNLEKKLFKNRYYKAINIGEKIFSIKNNKGHKIVKIFGIKIKFKHLKGQFKKEEQYIKKIKCNRKKYPKDCYLLFDCLNGDLAECIDAYSLFLYMKNQGKKAYYVILKNTTLYKQLKQDGNLENIIALDNPTTTHPGDFFKAIYNVMLHTKAVITAFGIFTKAGEEYIINDNTIKYIFIQHGVVFLKETVMTSGLLKTPKYDKVLISSEYEYKVFKKYNWSDNKLIKCGLPRWDLLPQKNSDEEKSIFVMFTWRRFDIGKFEVSLYKKNIINLLSNPVLQNLLEQNNIKLYFAPHHSLFGLRGIDFKLDIPNITMVDSSKVSEYIRKCSCLITDWSSVAFDFMFQNKLVIFYILDKGDNTLGKADKIDIKHFDYKQYLIPNVTFNEDDVIKILKIYVENNFQLEPEIKDKYNKFFYTKENIREQLIDKIDKICK